MLESFDWFGVPSNVLVFYTFWSDVWVKTVVELFTGFVDTEPTLHEIKQLSQLDSEI